MTPIAEPTDRTDLCAPCSSGELCVAHAPLFCELDDGPGYAAPETWGATYTVPAPSSRAFEVQGR